jgi:hypothetical protein
MRTLSVVSLLAMMLIATPSFAAIYKCVSKDGVVSFSDEPCSREAEVFLKTPAKISIDDAISLASPFPELSIDSRTIEDDLLAHAKKTGKSILPDETYNTYTMRGGERRRHRYPKWEVSLNYGPPDKPSKWKITLKYSVRFKNKIPRVWLNMIYVQLWRKYYDPPSIHNAKKIERIRTGKWQLIGWIK